MTGTLADLVRRAAAADPDRPICDFFEAGEVLTRRELDRDSNRVANGLRAIGIRPGDRVGVMLPNRREYPITWIALARLGAAIVPVNPRYTPRELAFVLGHAGCRGLVIDEEHLPVLAALPDRPRDLENERVVIRGAPALPGSRTWQGLRDLGRDPEVDDGTPGSIINVQYTSGTTGFPKGCLAPQSYWTLMARQTRDWMAPAGPIARMLIQNPFHYMNGPWLLSTALEIGATLLVAPSPSASRFLPWIKRTGAQWCVFPEIVLKQPPAADDGATGLRLACLVAVSGAAQLEVERRFRVPGRELYGMTEIGGGAAMPVGARGMDGLGSIGLPMTDRRCTIRDEAGGRVEAGGTGELWVAGPSLMRGYHDDPAATEAAFRGEWFRTGDLARADERGYLWIVGRAKDMIRRSGENVAAREVEAVLSALPEIAEAAVLPVPDPDRGEEVKAVVALAPGFRADAALLDRVRRQAAEALAPFKVPRYWAVLPELPRTPSNKIAKPELKRAHGTAAGAWDAVDRVWRDPAPETGRP